MSDENRGFMLHRVHFAAVALLALLIGGAYWLGLLAGQNRTALLAEAEEERQELKQKFDAKLGNLIRENADLRAKLAEAKSEIGRNVVAAARANAHSEALSSELALMRQIIKMQELVEQMKKDRQRLSPRRDQDVWSAPESFIPSMNRDIGVIKPGDDELKFDTKK